MEEIYVLYRIEGPTTSKIDKTLEEYSNCLPLQIPRGKEVLLVDIINYLLQWTQLSANFSFTLDLRDGK